MKYIPLISSVIAIVCVSVFVLYQNNELNKVINGLLDKNFIIWLILTLAYSTYILYNKAKNEDEEKSQKATRHAIMALIIAYFSRLDLVIAPFWVVWVFSYYTDDLEGWI